MRTLGFLYLALGSLALAQAVVGVYPLPPTPIRALNPHLTPEEVERALRAGWPTETLPSLGSGLAYLGGGRFVGLTDRGPNGDCPDGRGKWFPLPRFAPALVFLRLEAGALKLDRALPLKNPLGKPVTGLPNLPGEDRPFADKACGEPLPLDPDGLDTEDVAPTPTGAFWLVEEHSPSLLYVDPEGRIQVRYVPQGLGLKASYPVQEVLPPILRLRRNNRGLENLALSADGKTAWVVLQSPIGPTSDPGFAESLVARAVRLDVSDPMRARVTGMYLVPFSDPKDYPKKSLPKDMMFSAAQWVKGEQVLLLERAKGGARVFLVDFAKATNLLEHPEGQSEALDRAGVDYGAKGIRLAERRLVLETWRLKEVDTAKLEGLALLEDGRTLALINDNDFAIEGDEGPTRLWLVRLEEALR
jgi:alkaline phosphatase